MELELLQEADAFAAAAHQGQSYGENEPYIEHPRRVAAQISDPELKIVALLHDTVEDTPVTLEEINRKFGLRIATAVDALTRREGENYRRDYLPRLALNQDAIVVKIADLNDNYTNAKRKGGRYASLIPRYEAALKFLKQA